MFPVGSCTQASVQPLFAQTSVVDNVLASCVYVQTVLSTANTSSNKPITWSQRADC